jgi:hypothetical protein
VKIPDYPDFKPLSADDQEEIEADFKSFSPETSDYSFANLFIWREYDYPLLTRIKGTLCVLLQPADGTPYFLPPAGREQTEEILGICFSHLKKLPQLRMAPEKFAKKHFEKKLEYRFELDHANSDYIYRVSEQIILKGRKYDGKRNWVKRFLAKYTPEYVELSPGQVSEALALLERWKINRTEAVIKYELRAIAQALQNYERLKLFARGIRVAGKLAAFMLGGELNPEMAIIYIQVSDREMPGLPQYFHQQFASRELKQYKYVNWEQDLGIAGLRRAKLSYHPCRVIYKYSVSRPA